MSVAAEDIEAGRRERIKFQTEPTLPIYLKVKIIVYIHILHVKKLIFFISNIFVPSSTHFFQ